MRRVILLCALSQFAVTLISAAKLELQTDSIPKTGTVGSNYSGTAKAKGGDAPYSFSVSSGSLPAGLSMSGSGAITGTPSNAGVFAFSITVTDRGGDKDDSSVTILISPAPLTITTSSPLPAGSVGMPYSQNLSASGGVPPYRWSGSGAAGLSVSAEGSITGTPTSAGSFSLSATIADSSGLRATKTLAITINPPPVTVTTTSPLPSGAVGVAYSQSLSASGGTPPYRWSGSGSAGLSLAANGAISGTPTTAGNFTLAATVTDARSNSANRTFAISIQAALTITSGALLPNGTVGVAYAQSLSASGGTPPYKWSGSAPAGLSLRSDGSINGTPNASGSFSFVAQVSDNANATATRNFNLTIAPAGAPPLSITSTSSLPSATKGTSYSQMLSASGGTPPYRWSGSAPGGLSLGADGSIGGTPNVEGSFSFAVQVMDSASAVASRTFAITIVASASSTPLTISSSSLLPHGTMGVTYSQSLSASGGTPPYKWSGSAPVGLTLGADGSLNGTPTADGTFNFTAQVTDNAGTQASRTFTLTIDTRTVPLSISTSATLSSATVRTPYVQTLSASGGTPPYTWTVLSGALPDGFNLDPNGTLSGSAGTVGAFSFVVQATDSGSLSFSKRFTITVTSGLTITTAPSLPSAAAGSPYSQALSSTGGVAPLVWSIVAGSLPAGLALDGATGSLTGTVTATGSYTFTAQVSDRVGAIATKQFSLFSALGLTITSAPVLSGGSVSVAYSQAITATGGIPPLTWTVSTGELPAGLSVDPLKGTLAGVPSAAGSFDFTVQVNDSAGSKASKPFTVTISPGLVVATPPVLPNGTVGAAYAQTLTVAGGRSPYVWSVSAGALPPGMILDPLTGQISGAGTAPGSFTFTAQVSDANSQIASKDFTITVARVITINAPALVSNTMAGSAFAMPLNGSGGTPPLNWALASGSLPDGVSLDASSGAVSGTPTSSGVFSFSIQVTDAAGAVATKDFTLTVDTPPLPALSFSAGSGTSAAAQQISLDLVFSAAYPLPVPGTATIRFIPDPAVGADDPSVQFATGGRSASFLIPANSTRLAPPIALQTGTVTGTIEITIRAQGLPEMTRTIMIPRTPPVIRSLKAVQTTTGFELRASGFSTSREVTQATVRFSGVGLQTTELTVQLSEVSKRWYESSASTSFGSQFSLTLPFTVQGDPSTIHSATISIANSQGPSLTTSVDF